MKKSVAAILFIILFAILTALTVSADDKPERIPRDGHINGECTFEASDGSVLWLSLDDDDATFVPLSGDLTVHSEQKIFGIYLLFDRPPCVWTMKSGDETVSCGENGFIHEFVPLSGETEAILSFPEEVKLSGVYVLGGGELPDWVQQWEPAEGRADILMLPSHSDDDQLFFAGLIPYSVSRGYSVQVAYFVNHWETHDRTHELLNGLWSVGATRYPVMGELPDYWSDSEELAKKTYWYQGYTYDGMIAHQCELFRRFRPQIVFTHAFDGEYGHGTHILSCKSAVEAAELSGDSEKYPESAEIYGVWEPGKVYVHNYEENRVILPLDEPLEMFGGKTAFHLSQDAYRFHYSQHRFKDLSVWIYGHSWAPISKASEIPEYNPREYGLYRSVVGADNTEKPDIFDNIVSYAVQDAEEAERQEIETRRDTAAEKARQAIAARNERLAEESRLAEETTVPEKTTVAETTAPADTTGSEIAADKRGYFKEAVILTSIAAFVMLISTLIIRKKK